MKYLRSFLIYHLTVGFISWFCGIFGGYVAGWSLFGVFSLVYFINVKKVTADIEAERVVKNRLKNPQCESDLIAQQLDRSLEWGSPERAEWKKRMVESAKRSQK